MKTYLLEVNYYDEDICNNDSKVDVYSNLKEALNNGKQFLQDYKCSESFRDYNLSITETDLEYSENFNIKKLNLKSNKKEELGKYEPTHIVYNYDIDGKLKYKNLEYRYKGKYIAGFLVYPEDTLRNAGKKYKIGDIVKIRNDINRDELYMSGFIENVPSDKLYVVRFLPRKVKGQKYFQNIYALISTYDNENMRGLFTFEEYESHIEKYDGKIDSKSFIPILQKIINGEINISDETWQSLKNGQISFDTRKRFDELEIF